MAAKHSKSAATGGDRLRRDEAIMEKLGIHHKPLNTSDTWPLHLRNTFESIKSLGSREYQSYDENQPAQHSTVAWRREIKLRAKQLSDTAQRLFKECPSELTWRLELEKLVDARFRLKTEWYASSSIIAVQLLTISSPLCSDARHSARMWRSEIEVLTECNGPITIDLESRRNRRVPCQCDDKVYTGLNPLFSNRADQAFSYESHLIPSQDVKSLTKRRPDRVYGIRETRNFKEALGKVLDDTNKSSIAAVLHTIDPDTEEMLIRDFIQATPYNRCGEPLLFPFLMMEAKSEEGGGFSKSAIQTSLPIWSLLKGQERLSELGTHFDELGGPLVWYIAYLGEKWSISGCCTTVERGLPVYVRLNIIILDVYTNLI